MKWPPDRAWVTVPRNRKVQSPIASQAEVVYADLEDAEVLGGVTSKLRTVVDCARRLPFDEALAIADSALRAGDVRKQELVAAAAALRGRGAPQGRAVAAAATHRSANPFESVLRAIAVDVPVLRAILQAPVETPASTFHPDLVDRELRIVIEADSWTFHSDQLTHGRDCVRYTAMAVEGWMVLRFTWDQVMHSPAHVRAVLQTAVAARTAAA